MPRGSIPNDVERYVREIRRQSPHYTEAQLWATAWSRYCRYKKPGSPHCHKTSRTRYFAGKKERTPLSRRKQKRSARSMRRRRYHANGECGSCTDYAQNGTGTYLAVAAVVLAGGGFAWWWSQRTPAVVTGAKKSIPNLDTYLR